MNYLNRMLVILILFFSVFAWTESGHVKAPQPHSKVQKVFSKKWKSHSVAFDPKVMDQRQTWNYGGVGTTIYSNVDIGWFAFSTPGATSHTISVTKTGSSAFIQGSGCPSGSFLFEVNCGFEMYFAPTTLGPHVGTITITFEATYDYNGTVYTQGDTLVIQLTGEGLKKTPKIKTCPVKGASIIDPLARTFMEEIPLVGTDFTLQYNSRLSTDYVSDEGVLVSDDDYNKEGWVISAHKFFDYTNQRVFDGMGMTSVTPFIDETDEKVFVTSSDGKEIYVFDDYPKHIKTVTALTGAIKYEFNYDADDLLETIVDGYGNTTTITRNSSGNITKLTGPYGQETFFTLNANGLFSTVTNPKGEVHTFTYKSGTSLLETFKKPGNQVTTLTYDADGKIIKDLAHGGNFWNFVNGTSGQIIRASQMGRSASYSSSYSSVGLSTQTMTDADLSTTENIEDLNENSTITNEMESTVVTRVDDERLGPIFKRPSVQTYTIGGVTSTTTYNQYVSPGTNYFDFSSLTNVITTDGLTTTESWDNSTRVLTRTSPEGIETVTQFDVNENPTQIKLGNLTPLSMAYDSHGRLSQQNQGTYNQFNYSYNTNGLLSKITNGRAEETLFGYDLAGRLTTKVFPDARIIQYQYDTNGNMTGVTPPGRPLHVFGFNAMELNSSYQSPSVSSPTSYSYNLDKQLTSISRPNGKTASLNYHSTKGTLSQISVLAGNYTYSYSSTVPGQVATIQSPYGVINSYTYRGPIVSQDEQIRSSDSVSMGKVSFGFDTSHRLTSRTIQDSSMNTFTRNMQLNDDGKPVHVGDMKLAYNRSTGLLLKADIGKISDSWAYDSYGNVTAFASVLISPSGPTVVNYMYVLTRDNMSRVTNMSETVGSTTNNFEYQYDFAGRLVLVKKNSVTIANFTYDSNSNRISQTIGGVTTTATFDNDDRMTNFGSKIYSYDNNGDLTETETSIGAHAYFTYDVFGNLTQATPTSGINYSYIMDGRNRLVGKSVSGVLNRRYLYEDQLKVTAQLDASGVLQKEFVYASGLQTPDYMVVGSDKYRIITNHLGSPRVIINVSTGAVAQNIDYNVLGKVTLDSNPDFQPFGFAGGLYDQHSGLVRFGARDYDAETGRWTTKDPILFAGGDTNLYGYVLNDPVNFVDPTGTTWKDVKFGNVVAGGFLMWGGIGLIAGSTATAITGPLAAAGVFAGTAGVLTGGGLLTFEWENFLKTPEYSTQTIPMGGISGSANACKGMP